MEAQMGQKSPKRAKGKGLAEIELLADLVSALHHTHNLQLLLGKGQLFSESMKEREKKGRKRREVEEREREREGYLRVQRRNGDKWITD